MASVPIYARGDRQKLRDLRVEVDVAKRQLAERLEQAGKAPSPRFGDEAPDEVRLAREAVARAEAEYDAFIDEAADRADEWEVEPIGHEVWGELLAAHPPRKITEGEGDDAKEVTDPRDFYHGVNTETFGKALLLFVDPEDGEHRTVIKAGDTELSKLGTRLRRLPKGEFDTLWMVAYEQNIEVVSDPKASRYSTGARSDGS